MDYPDFRNLAIDSTDIYYDYLQMNGKGMVETKVTQIVRHGGEFFLQLQGRMSSANLDSIELKIYADRYSNEKVHPIEYDSTTNVLIIRPSQKICQILRPDICDHVTVVCDLLFLVRRVGEWYRNNSIALSLPASASGIPAPAFHEMAGGIPSDEQYSAVCGVLCSPLSYVWGAPGTGKTRFVLANCVLTYLRHDKKVLLVAPTNNALDQMLSGILEVLTTVDIPQSRIRRLGIPSTDFAKRYPDICERRSAEQRRLQLEKQICSLKERLQWAASRQAAETSLDALSSLIASYGCITQAYRSQLISLDVVSSTAVSVQRLDTQVRVLSQRVSELSTWRTSFPGYVCRFFNPRKYAHQESALTDASCELDGLNLELSAIRHKLEAYEEANRSAEFTYSSRLEDLHRQYTSLCLSSPDPKISAWASVSIATFPHAMEDIALYLRSICKDVQNEDTDKLTAYLSSLEEELAQLSDSNTTEWADVRVLAMTIDRYIATNYSASFPDFTPEHIFMDEAAYCSLIKAYTLLGLNRPLTLLGDHSQLPPVCEMSEAMLRKGPNSSVFVWAQSAIYLESVFCLPFQQLHAQFQSTSPPIFQKMPCYMLSATYRFGPVLADILAQFVYTRSFKSIEDRVFSIKYISARRSQNDAPRGSLAECQAVSSLVNDLSAKNADYVVLTPYRSQLGLLSKRLRKASSDGRIMTIHASQGREFDTVVLSVVDTTNKYYTNSSVPIGKMVLNTAISRAKKELILVLDSDYWAVQENQLIGHLLRIASPYSSGFQH